MDISPRIQTLDALRGFALLHMMAFHFCFDYFVLFGSWGDWHTRPLTLAWQQAICCSFILLAGYCHRLSRHPGKKGLILSLAGLAITVLTAWAIPSQTVIFGILNLLGASSLLAWPWGKPVTSPPGAAPLPADDPEGKSTPGRLWAGTGLAASLGLFLLFHQILWYKLDLAWPLDRLRRQAALLPDFLTIPLGFPPPGFSSGDYFPLLPWFFLYTAGLCLHHLRPPAGQGSLKPNQAPDSPSEEAVGSLKRPFYLYCVQTLARMGRHSLLIYLLHQPFLAAAAWLLRCLPA